MKRLVLLILMMLALLVVGCNQQSVQLPDLSGLGREAIAEKLDKTGIKYFFKIRNLSYTDESQYDKFIAYGSDYEAGDWISRDASLYVYTTALPLTVNRLDEVRLDTPYEGKSFVNDGIGTVTLYRAVDGDTAHFYDDATHDFIKVRFLGIDTPESTKLHEAWGKAASSFTAGKLQEADVIVLEAEGPRKDTYDRYLAWIWVDGTLLNLELLQEAYTGSKVGTSSRYFDLFTEVESEVSKTGRRVWGEIDPSFVY